MAGILFVGLVAYPLLPVAPLPQVDFPTIQVSASLPGASPETMASSVAQPLERQFAQIPGVAQMTSTSSLGTASITIQFDLNRNIDGAANDVQAAINAAGGQLPKNLPSPPTYRKVNPADSPILLLSATSDTLPLTTVERRRRRAARAADQPDLRRRPGHHRRPAEAGDPHPDRSGEARRQGPVARGRAQPDRDHDRRQPEGQHRRRRRAAYTIYANDQLTAVQGLERRHHRLSQRRAVADPRHRPGRHRPGGRQAGGLGQRQARRVPGRSSSSPAPTSSRPSTRSRRTLPRLVAAIPPAIKVELISDRTQTIRAAVEDVQFTLLLTIALVVMVIFLFLRSFWATVIPSVTVPLALLGACALMWVFGYTLDNLSLMALTIAVGFVVDDAIVMLENITRHIEEGETPLAAAFKGAGEIGFTIVSISISLVAVLIPLLLMGGIIGRLFREFAVTLAMTIFVSMVVSLTLTPMMASRFLRAHSETQARPLLSVERARLRRACCTAMSAASTSRLRWQLDHAAGLLRDAGAVGLSVRDHSRRASSRSRIPA